MLLPTNADINNIYKIFVYHKILKNTSETSIFAQYCWAVNYQCESFLPQRNADHSWMPYLTRTHLTSGVAKWVSAYFKDFTWFILLCGSFQTMGPVTTHSLLWLISPFLSAWRQQRLKCWLIWFLSLTHHFCCQCLTRPEHQKCTHPRGRRLPAEKPLSSPPPIRYCLDSQQIIYKVKIWKSFF